MKSPDRQTGVNKAKNKTVVSSVRPGPKAPNEIKQRQLQHPTAAGQPHSIYHGSQKNLYAHEKGIMRAFGRAVYAAFCFFGNIYFMAAVGFGQIRIDRSVPDFVLPVGYLMTIFFLTYGVLSKSPRNVRDLILIFIASPWFLIFLMALPEIPRLKHPGELLILLAPFVVLALRIPGEWFVRKYRARHNLD